MKGRSFFDMPTVPRLPSVLEEVRTGNLTIPDFQRPFVWDDDRRLRLLDSVANGMPIGSFLVWRTRQHTLETYDSLGPFKLPQQPREGEIKTYVMDGHQRLSTLFAALNWVDDPEAASAALGRDDVRWPIYYDLESQDFVLSRRGSDPPSTWLDLSILLHPKQLYAFQKTLIEAGADEAAERAEELASIFKDYQIPVVPLISEDLDLVTDAFVRVNSQGKPMRETFMVHALAYTEFDVRGRFDILRERLAPLGWSALDDQVLLNALKARYELDVHRAGPRHLHEKIKASGSYEAAFDELERNLVHVVPFLASVHVCGAAALPYASQLIALIEAARHLGGPLEGDFADHLRDWFWATTYTGYFKGMAANRIRDAIEHVVRLVCRGGPRYPSDLPRMVERLSRYYYQATRSRAFVLLLLRHSQDLEAAKAVGQEGAQAVERLIPHLDRSAPSNQVVISLNQLQGLRLALQNQNDLLEPYANDDFLARHVIREDALACARAGDERGFLDCRGAALMELEAHMVRELGLSFTEED